MVKILRTKLYPQVAKLYDEAKTFVNPKALWYGYELDKNEVIPNLYLAIAELSDGVSAIETPVVMYEDFILSASKAPINDVIAACVGTKYSVPQSTAFGYIDDVNRGKYLSTPIDPYWDGLGNPIIMFKGKLK